MSRSDKRFFLSLACCTFALALVSSAIAEKGGNPGGKHGKANAAQSNKGGGNRGDGGNPHHADKGGGPPSHSNAGGGKAGGPPAHSNAGGGGNAAAKGNAKKFAANDRSEIQTYYRESYSRSGNCPPGLAKKDNGCMPPGQARKWSAGSTLPSDVVIVPVPSDLRMRLAPPVVGYEYGYVDGGVVLYAPETRLVVDFVAVF